MRLRSAPVALRWYVTSFCWSYRIPSPFFCPRDPMLPIRDRGGWLLIPIFGYLTIPKSLKLCGSHQLSGYLNSQCVLVALVDAALSSHHEISIQNLGMSRDSRHSGLR